MKRREFVAGLVGGAVCGGMVQTSLAASTNKVTILHTNDTHSRIDPFAGGRYKGMGGIARRAALIASIKKAHPATLVVDAGDIFQGTPYFNIFRGQLELKTMSMAGYDVATLGNHDFDLGSAWMLKMVQQHASFSFVSANYEFSQSAAKKLIQPYQIKVVNGWRIGFFGLGVRFRGLVSQSLHKGVVYQPPVAVARQVAATLRSKHRCDAVVALSHLGYSGFDGEVGDRDLAKQVPGIDVIIGGHTHTFLKKPTVVMAPDGRQTHIVQVGHSGIYLGQIDLHFGGKSGPKVTNAVHPVHR